MNRTPRRCAMADINVEIPAPVMTLVAIWSGGMTLSGTQSSLLQAGMHFEESFARSSSRGVGLELDDTRSVAGRKAITKSAA